MCGQHHINEPDTFPCHMPTTMAEDDCDRKMQTIFCAWMIGTQQRAHVQTLEFQQSEGAIHESFSIKIKHKLPVVAKEDCNCATCNLFGEGCACLVWNCFMGFEKLEVIFLLLHAWFWTHLSKWFIWHKTQTSGIFECAQCLLEFSAFFEIHQRACSRFVCSHFWEHCFVVSCETNVFCQWCGCQFSFGIGGCHSGVAMTTQWRDQLCLTTTTVLIVVPPIPFCSKLNFSSSPNWSWLCAKKDMFQYVEILITWIFNHFKCSRELEEFAFVALSLGLMNN